MIAPDEVLHASIVQALSSSTETGVCVLNPVAVLQASMVQAFPSSFDVTVITTVEVTAGHGPDGSLVDKVRITVPLEMLGV